MSFSISSSLLIFCLPEPQNSTSLTLFHVTFHSLDLHSTPTLFSPVPRTCQLHSSQLPKPSRVLPSSLHGWLLFFKVLLKVSPQEGLPSLHPSYLLAHHCLQHLIKIRSAYLSPTLINSVRVDFLLVFTFVHLVSETLASTYSQS